jgi:D-tagatose-1,6-bisphosphate aldolase subunit GatZ/KbaZ
MTHLFAKTGICSICSSGGLVIETALEHANMKHSDLVIESTCNQVNQYGGYTGMTPADFAAYVKEMARGKGLPHDMPLIGGDHLGPYPWRHESAENAMAKAAKLVSDCISAGYGKIHVDCSMPLSDDVRDKKAPHHVSPELSAQRTFLLCKTAESARTDLQREQGLPLYVIGAETPTPGGAIEQPLNAPVTRPEDLSEFIGICEPLFLKGGLEDAWHRTVAIVVQPGIDFSSDAVIPYNKERARKLSDFHDQLPHQLTYEVHATDFQTEERLSEMVKDHFTVLKTGPVLTFAFRESVFALAHIENELLKKKKNTRTSDIIRVIDQTMIASPEHWRSHVREDDEDARIQRIFGLTDRVRYYWNYPAVKKSFAVLVKNLEHSIPTVLISQYIPDALRDVIDGKIPANPLFLMKHRISQALLPYIRACRENS